MLNKRVLLNVGKLSNPHARGASFCFIQMCSLKAAICGLVDEEELQLDELFA
jgi:hypothetical protein